MERKGITPLRPLRKPSASSAFNSSLWDLRVLGLGMALAALACLDWRLHRSGPRLSNHGRGAQDRRHLVHERCRTPLLLCKLEHTRRGNNYTSGEEEKERKEKGKGTYAASIT